MSLTFILILILLMKIYFGEFVILVFN